MSKRLSGGKWYSYTQFYNVTILNGTNMLEEKLLNDVKEHIEEVIERKTARGLLLWQQFIDLHPADTAQFFTNLSPELRNRLFATLPSSVSCEVFREFSESLQAQLLSFLNDTGKIDALSCLTIDELTDLFENFSDAELKKYLNLLHKNDRERVLSLMQFDPESAGGIMDIEALALQEDFTVQKSIQLIQRLQVKKELHRQIFVVNRKKQLVGHIMLEDLVLQKPETHIADFVQENELVAQANEDQESIAQKMVHYKMLTVPVVGANNYFLGIIPVDTLVDVLEEEASEDIYRMSAMQPIKGTYFEDSLWTLLSRRSYILIVLLLAQSLSSIIIEFHEALLAGFLIRFITMLVSTGGNASSQTSAIIIQGMASGEINEHNIRRFFRREISLALMMGLVLGTTAFIRVYVTSYNLLGSVVVSLSLFSIVVVSMVIGSSFPFILKRFNLDPAYSAGPVLATLMDILGLFIYCLISRNFF